MRNSDENSFTRLPHLAGTAAAALILVCFTAADAQQAVSSKLTIVDHAMMPSAVQIQNWLDQKDSWGPAYTAGPGWKKFMAMLHAEMKSTGMVNVGDYPYPYTRWYTSEFPDKSGWSLTSDGKAVDVASYGTQSGSTGPGGVTAPMVLYDLNLPVAQRPALSTLAGKIVVVKQQPFATLWRARPEQDRPQALGCRRANARKLAGTG